MRSAFLDVYGKWSETPKNHAHINTKPCQPLILHCTRFIT